MHSINSQSQHKGRFQEGWQGEGWEWCVHVWVWDWTSVGFTVNIISPIIIIISLVGFIVSIIIQGTKHRRGGRSIIAFITSTVIIVTTISFVTIIIMKVRSNISSSQSSLFTACHWYHHQHLLSSLSSPLSSSSSFSSSSSSSGWRAWCRSEARRVVGKISCRPFCFKPKPGVLYDIIIIVTIGWGSYWSSHIVITVTIMR